VTIKLEALWLGTSLEEVTENISTPVRFDVLGETIDVERDMFLTIT